MPDKIGHGIVGKGYHTKIGHGRVGKRYNTKIGDGKSVAC